MNNPFDSQVKHYVLNREELRTRIIVNPEFELMKYNDPFDPSLKEQLELQMTGYIYSMNKQEANITCSVQVEIEPPKFTDWLFKKKRIRTVEKVFKVSTKDVLLNPPVNIPGQQFLRLATFEPMEITNK